MINSLRGMGISSDTLTQINQTTSQLQPKKTLLDYINSANTYVDKGSALVNKVQNTVSSYTSGSGTSNNGGTSFVPDTNAPGNDPPKKASMSTGVKVAIGVAGAALLTGIIYAVVPKKKKDS